MLPLRSCFDLPARDAKTLTIRPILQSAIDQMGNWIIQQNWVSVYDANDANEKVQIFEKILYEKFNELMPQKIVKISSDDVVDKYCMSYPFFNNLSNVLISGRRQLNSVRNTFKSSSCPSFKHNCPGFV